MQNLQTSPTDVKSNPTRSTDHHLDLFRHALVGDASGYIIKRLTGEWSTEPGPPSDLLLLQHLDQELWIGGRYREVTSVVHLDFDNTTPDRVNEFLEFIGASPANSRVYTSPSPGSFHVHLRVAPMESPIPIEIARAPFTYFPKKMLCGVYPQPLQGFRYPFGKDQKPVYDCCRDLDGWRDFLDDLLSLDIFDIHTLRPYDHQNLELTLDIPDDHHRPVTPVLIDLSPRTKPRRDTFHAIEEEAAALMETGLTGPGTRDRAQFVLFCVQYRQGRSLDEARRFVSEFIENRHNGQSDDFNHDREYVFNHIFGQGKRIYEHYTRLKIRPDDIKCSENEYTTKASIPKIFSRSNGKLPPAKSLFHWVKYSSSRDHRELIRIRWDKLADWSGIHTYLKRIDDLKISCNIERGSAYHEGDYSKYFILPWDHGDPADAILIDGRHAETLEEAVTASYTPAEARRLLRDTGFTRKNAEKIVRRWYYRCGDKKWEHCTSGVRGGEVAFTSKDLHA